MLDFCAEYRIATRAHVCLAKADVLSLPCLQRDDMTPTQAAIKFNSDRNCCALFGVDNLE